MPTFAGAGGAGNHNEKILALHNEGKSNVAIAKELGLGVGEVKLVIDLYRQS
ncbi:MAG: helix-turn-helix domain-containing protein [Lachnospiraceae bacterium]|nr:helix-turn-helix domain-containing protein [Lachnospiraceae bacterium]